MAAGQRTDDVTLETSLDTVLGHKDGGLARAAIAALAAQLAGSGAIFDALQSLDNVEAGVAAVEDLVGTDILGVNVASDGDALNQVTLAVLLSWLLSQTAASTAKSTLVSGDKFLVFDSENSFAPKITTLANVQTFLGV